jgi:hypothetical protein
MIEVLRARSTKMPRTSKGIVSRKAELRLDADLASVATTAAATAAAAAATTTVTAAATTTAAFFTRTGFVHGQRPTVLLGVVQPTDGFLRRIVVGHFHETKTLAPAGIAVVNDFSAFHRAVCRKQRLQARVIDIVAQIANI